jgi:hypothetical protein
LEDIRKTESDYDKQSSSLNNYNTSNFEVQMPRGLREVSNEEKEESEDEDEDDIYSENKSGSNTN